MYFCVISRPKLNVPTSNIWYQINDQKQSDIKNKSNANVEYKLK